MNPGIYIDIDGELVMVCHPDKEGIGEIDYIIGVGVLCEEIHMVLRGRKAWYKNFTL